MTSFIFTSAMLFKKKNFTAYTYYFPVEDEVEAEGFFFPMAMVLMFPQQPKATKAKVGSIYICLLI